MTEEEIFDDSMFERDDQCNDSDWEEYNAEEMYEFGGVTDYDAKPSKSIWQDLIEALPIIVIYLLACICYTLLICN